MKVKKHNRTNVIDEANCNEVTILSGGRNFIELITGPPNIDSTHPGTCTSGMASIGISVFCFCFPAAAFLLGAEERRVVLS
jgi:hypothetical protein